MNVRAVLLRLALGGALAAPLASGAAQAQALAADEGMSLHRAEQLAADLHQGMTLDEVQALLGKPQQTALLAGEAAPTSSSKGTMQWTYVWTGPTTRGRLRVDFTAQSVEAYRVTAWQWLSN